MKKKAIVSIPFKKIKFSKNVIEFNIKGKDYVQPFQGSQTEFNYICDKIIPGLFSLRVNIINKKIVIDGKDEYKAIKYLKSALDNNRNSVQKNFKKDKYKTQNHVQKKRVSKYIQIENKWKDLLFKNGYLFYFTNSRWWRIEKSESKIYLKYIKVLFEKENIAFKVEFKNGCPIDIHLPERIFTLVEYAENIYLSLNQKSCNAGYGIRKFGVSFTNHLKILNIEKTFYLNHLAKNCDESLDIICFHENTSFVPKGTQNLSFLFAFKRDNLYLLIWESVEYYKATFIFSLEKNSLKFNSIRQDIVKFLSSNTQNLRTLLSKHKTANLLNVDEIYKVIHNYNGLEDKSWIKKIKEKV